MQVAFVLWSGELGGAETFTADLAAEMRRQGVDARIVFIENGNPLNEILERESVPWEAMELPRGRSILRRPRAYAEAIASQGEGASVLMSGRYMATALRLGGYQGRVIAVEHGDMLIDRGLPAWGRWMRSLDRSLSVRSIDLEIGVSQFMVAEVRRRPHVENLRCIPLGISVQRYKPTMPLNRTGNLRLGMAARLIHGKGVDYLLRAIAILSRNGRPVQLKVAGDGPLRGELVSLREHLDLADEVEFIGRTNDMPGFWNSCDVAVAPSAEFIESFGVTPLEAAACGRPAIVSRNGGLVEMDEYAGDRQRLESHGEAARTRAETEFSMERCASAYIDAVAP
jgi:glycosyltransferase involved in cell wall biosynthesis